MQVTRWFECRCRLGVISCIHIDFALSSIGDVIRVEDRFYGGRGATNSDQICAQIRLGETGFNFLAIRKVEIVV